MIFSSLDTIGEFMREDNRIKWVVEDSNKDILKTLDPDGNTSPEDSFATLNVYLNTLRGNGYVVIKVYARNYKANSGGELKKMVRSFNIPVGNYTGTSGIGGFSSQQNNSANDAYTELKVMIAEMRKDKEIEKLERELDEAKKAKRGKPDFFEGAIKGIATEITRELLLKNGYTIEGLQDEDEGVVVRKQQPVKKDVTQAPATDSTQKPADAVNAIKTPTSKEALIELGNSTADIVNSLKPYGFSPEDVAGGFKQIAELAKTDPVKVQKILQDLGVKHEE